MKRFVIILLCLLLFGVPFILQTSFYPAMRFGMFAEPPKNATVLENYEVRDQNGLITPNALGIPPSVYHQLSQNYYYRGEGEVFLAKLNSLRAVDCPCDLIKVTYSQNSTDSTACAHVE